MTLPDYITEGTEAWKRRKEVEKRQAELTPSASYGGSAVTPERPAFAETDEGGFITLGPGVTPRSGQQAFEQQVETAWTALVNRSFGTTDTPFPTNWWPGIEVENVYADLQHYGPGPFGPTGLDRNLHPERWAAGADYVRFWDEETGQEDQIWVRYDPTRAAQQFFAMDNATREEYNTLMAQAGIIPEGYEGLADYSMEGANAFAQVLQMANYYGISARQVLQRATALAARGRRGGGGGGRGPTVKVKVPDYETLLVDAETAIQAAVGRDIDDWEMAVVADHMQDRYGEWAAAEKRAALGGNGTYEIPDPVKLSQKFVKERYSSEIERLEDVADQRQTNQILINAATKGTQMMGGLSG